MKWPHCIKCMISLLWETLMTPLLKAKATRSHTVTSKASWFCQPHRCMWIVKTLSLQSERDSGFSLALTRSNQHQLCWPQSIYPQYKNTRETQKRPRAWCATGLKRNEKVAQVKHHESYRLLMSCHNLELELRRAGVEKNQIQNNNSSSSSRVLDVSTVQLYWIFTGNYSSILLICYITFRQLIPV